MNNARVLIVGGGGMLGRKLARRLLAQGRIGKRALGSVHLVDLKAPDVADLGTAASAEAEDIVAGDLDGLLVRRAPDYIFHLAAIVSGEAEQNFPLGYAVNVEGTRRLLEAARLAANRPRFVFSSSLAVFGGRLPDIVPDSQRTTPQSSYGAQKAIGELLVADYARKGYVDGVALRLPTIVVRPGAPNKAASSFLSSILREPLAGKDAVLPVADDVAAWIASPGIAIGSLIHAAEIDVATLSTDHALTGRGITVTAGEMLDALSRIAGAKAVARVRRSPDETVARIVGSWPKGFTCDAATRFGFPVDESIDAIIRAYIDEELNGIVAA